MPGSRLRQGFAELGRYPRRSFSEGRDKPGHDEYNMRTLWERSTIIT
ncbi:hypothetical protein ACVIHI_007846 [Bradyrhizobium sp. USDA 4524]|nr:hypothetical protein [Bradyrhizobium sp. USDA 4545]MCP1839241.1 hypothetical protein [Bradyrhizobium sp. USDA 4538]MCP1899805.1 hypothetical protein [Bradyrhizobium sp. USDA 4537]MCP1920769.1 hypothetical protein [Bradyrhizobium sp. USDA 4532]MCP1986086.1 hypothetical protein [Bradyrhizobium sp. USDA 4539]